MVCERWQNGFMAPPVTSNSARPAQATTAFGVSADPYGLDGEDEPEPVRCVGLKGIMPGDQRPILMLFPLLLVQRMA